MDKRKIRYESDKKRDKIIERDGYKCVVCESPQPLEVHHILAIYRGGTEDDDNLVTLCRSCHAKAPETGKEDFEKYMKDPGRNIAERMLGVPKIRETFEYAMAEFWVGTTQTHVEKGFITEEQRMEIIQYEIEQLKGNIL